MDELGFSLSAPVSDGSARPSGAGRAATQPEEPSMTRSAATYPKQTPDSMAFRDATRTPTTHVPRRGVLSLDRVRQLENRQVDAQETHCDSDESDHEGRDREGTSIADACATEQRRPGD